MHVGFHDGGVDAQAPAADEAALASYPTATTGWEPKILVVCCPRQQNTPRGYSLSRPGSNLTGLTNQGTDLKVTQLGVYDVVVVGWVDAHQRLGAARHLAEITGIRRCSGALASSDAAGQPRCRYRN